MTFFLEEIEFTVSTPSKYTKVAQKTVDLINHWKDTLNDDRQMFQHFISSEVEFDQNVASVLTKSYSFQRAKDGNETEFRELWGDYTHHLVETETGWKCSAVQLFIPLKSPNYDLKDFFDGIEEN